MKCLAYMVNNKKHNPTRNYSLGNTQDDELIGTTVICGGKEILINESDVCCIGKNTDRKDKYYSWIKDYYYNIPATIGKKCELISYTPSIDNIRESRREYLHKKGYHPTPGSFYKNKIYSNDVVKPDWILDDEDYISYKQCGFSGIEIDKTKFKIVIVGAVAGIFLFFILTIIGLILAYDVSNVIKFNGVSNVRSSRRH